MRDPRLSEIELLSQLERGPIKLSVFEGAPGGHFGLSSGDATREMLFYMLAEELLVGTTLQIRHPLSSYAQSPPSDELRTSKLNASTLMRAGHEVTYQITHKGRVHLWRRRDELRSDRGREQMGVLFDKRSWERELAVQLLFATETAPFSLLALDLDHFKAVNDNLLHDYGDKVLQRYMEIVRDVIGDHGDAYRIGGDEVCVALAQTPRAKAEALAENIRVGIEREFQQNERLREKSIAVTASIGVATFASAVAPDVAKNFADERLYEAKRGGKNRVIAAEFIPPQP